MNRSIGTVIALAAALAAAACGGAPETARASADGAAPVGVIDSIFPPEEALRRFQASLAHAVDALDNAAPTRDALVERFVEALAAADRDALIGQVMDRAEFAYLYYEHTRFTRPPYELGPEILWFQMQNRSGRGLTRLLDRMAGQPLGYRGYRCAPEPVEEGPNRVWADCVVLFTGADGEPLEARLFGSILERDGRFKLVSFSNDL